MRQTIITITLALFWSCSQTSSEAESNNQQDQHQENVEHNHIVDTSQSKPKSPPKMAMANIGDNHVHIEYHAPSKRGRMVFGGLVGYGDVWVTGAHSATVINFSKNVKIGNIDIEAGKYALFTIPGEQEWVVIINTNWDQHLADEYDQEKDLVRLLVKPVKLTQPVELLTFQVTEVTDNSGTISVSWDDILVSFEISNS